MDEFGKNIRHIINCEIDKVVDTWRSKLKTAQEEQGKIQDAWRKEREKNESLQSENKTLREALHQINELPYEGSGGKTYHGIAQQALKGKTK